MAYSLKKEGFKDVTVLEKTDRIGGKSDSLRFQGITQQISTSLWHSDYRDTLIPLLVKFGFLNDLYDGLDLKDFAYWLKNSPSVSAYHILAYRTFVQSL